MNVADQLNAISISDHPSRGWSRAVRIFFNLYKPSRIFATTATLLAMTAKNGPLGDTWLAKIETLLIDEASQLAAPTIALLAHRLPTSRPIIIGDPRQLAPYAPFCKSTLLRFLATGNTLANIEGSRKWTSLSLVEVYRSHGDITDLLSRTFYENKLRSAISNSQRDALLQEVHMPKEDCPFAIMDPEGENAKVETSWVNEREAEEAARLARLLAKITRDPIEVAVICLYRMQAELIREKLGSFPIFVATADASQGREFRATIVCTSRSHPPQDGQFFSDPIRVNVALSRSKELLVILGNPDIFREMPFWSEIYKAASDRWAITTTEDFFRHN